MKRFVEVEKCPCGGLHNWRSNIYNEKEMCSVCGQWRLSKSETFSVSDLISQVPDIREKLAECLYMSKAQRDCAEKFFKEKLVHWKDLEIREKNWDIIKDYWYALADSILQLFKEV